MYIWNKRGFWLKTRFWSQVLKYCFVRDLLGTKLHNECFMTEPKKFITLVKVFIATITFMPRINYTTTILLLTTWLIWIFHSFWKIDDYAHYTIRLLSDFVVDSMNMKYKFILRYTILLLCLAFVIERSVQCFKRFFKKPQAVEIKMTDGTNDILPHFTFCSKTRYNPNVFEECGLEIMWEFHTYVFFSFYFLCVI